MGVLGFAARLIGSRAAAASLGGAASRAAGSAASRSYLGALLPGASVGAKTRAGRFAEAIVNYGWAGDNLISFAERSLPTAAIITTVIVKGNKISNCNDLLRLALSVAAGASPPVGTAVNYKYRSIVDRTARQVMVEITQVATGWFGATAAARRSIQSIVPGTVIGGPPPAFLQAGAVTLPGALGAFGGVELVPASSLGTPLPFTVGEVLITNDPADNLLPAFDGTSRATDLVGLVTAALATPCVNPDVPPAPVNAPIIVPPGTAYREVQVPAVSIFDGAVVLKAPETAYQRTPHGVAGTAPGLATGLP